MTTASIARNHAPAEKGLFRGWRTIAFIVVALILLGSPVQAQEAKYKFDLGASLGMSGYIGDANSSNIFKRPGFDADVSFRYLPDTRWAIRTMFSTFGLSGSTEGMANYLPGDAVYEFTSQVYELGVRGEFNFFPYGIGETYKRLRRWSPYLTLGVGGAISASGGKIAAAFTVPMGLGVKFKLKEKINLFAEFTMTKAFSDKIDGPVLNDLNGIKTEFYKSTDWYSRLTVGVSFEFGERCETCHYYD